MGGAISIKSLNDSAQAIRALWEQVAALEDEPSMAALGYPPHFTFAIYDEIDSAVLADLLRPTFAGTGPFAITFDAVRHFEAEPLVLWACPSDASQLVQVHGRVHAAIDPELCRLHYRPGMWMPHCTLGTRVDVSNRDAAIALCKADFEPFEVLFDVAECISFPPIVSVEEWHLSA